MVLEHLSTWVIEYILNLIFWLWIIRWGGAEKLENTFIVGFFLNMFAVNWSSEVIKFYAWLILMGTTIWFIVGLVIADFRFHWALF